MSDSLEDLEHRVRERWVAASVDRTPDWPLPDRIIEWQPTAELTHVAEFQFPREQWVSYPIKRRLALMVADRLLDFEQLTDEQWQQLCQLIHYGGKTRIA